MNDAPVITESLREALEAFYEAYRRSSRVQAHTPGVVRSRAESVASEQDLIECMGKLAQEWESYNSPIGGEYGWVSTVNLLLNAINANLNMSIQYRATLRDTPEWEVTLAETHEHSRMVWKPCGNATAFNLHDALDLAFKDAGKKPK